MSAQGFAAALEDLGVRCEVEEQGRLAILSLVPPGLLNGQPTTDPSLALVMTGSESLVMTAPETVRRTIVRLGRAHGFTNVCVELDAAFSGD